ncbi:hypothetical protein LAD67_14925 [Escherichia coli]|nr:hypothetical protein [Escherichia coli]
MALTIATGFVVDDAICGDRKHFPLYRKRRKKPLAAALKGAA